MSAGLLVDARPGREAAFVMPAGEAVLLARWHETEGVFMGELADGRTLPVIEVRCPDGRVFKID